ncbi:Cytochrome P450 87A3 [Camellia lanceoleosa]|uniref:Cytochrome P450 87A3 n=1 Tax=Camellia lanceoleosa TaxID=1840588 RepID=A0ACC0GE12_9ERIC|nr:Cytochrome P450 87A3 [Camellia lanceoleosa]
MWQVGLCVVAVVTILICQWLYKWRNPKCNGVLPPGSMGLPFIGETFQLLIPNHSLDLHPFIKKRIEKYGKVFSTNLVGRPIVITADPKLNNYLIQQEGREVELWYLDTFQKVFGLEGEARPNAVGQIHKYVRGSYLNFFGVDRLRTKLLPEIETTVRINMHRWSTQGTIDAKKETANMVAIFAAKTLFGHDFEKSSDDIGTTIAGFVEGLLSFPLNIPGRPCLGKKVIWAKLKERIACPEEKKGDFLDQAVKDLNTDFLTENFVVSVIVGALFATVESISTSITLSFKLFEDHPWVVEDLVAEHDIILKNKEDKKSPLTWEEYKSMTVTMHRRGEERRRGGSRGSSIVAAGPLLLSPIAAPPPRSSQLGPASVADRRASAPGSLVLLLLLPSPLVYATSCWAIMIVNSTLQLNPGVFKDPLTFNPKRWEDIDPQIASKNFMPFGGGTRQCAGAELAKSFFAIFLHVLVSEYRCVSHLFHIS